MARDRKIEICALNIAANPHPPGVYRQILLAASKRITRARGSDFAKITAPTTSDDGQILTGRILVWTDIDMKGRWLDLEKEELLTVEDQDQINIPEKAKPNYRVFGYVFRVASHRLYFESLNEFGEGLGPTTARRVFENLVQADGVRPEATEVEVTVLPKEGAVEQVLKLPGLRSLEIKLLLPNADDIDPQARARIYQRMRAMRAKRLDERVVKQAGAASLIPDDELRELAAIAAENGSVKGEGREGNQTTVLSTTDIPRRERISLEAGRNLLARIVATVGFF